MKNEKIHYSGAVRTKKMRILPGWAACCSGERAEKIRRNGKNTNIIENVTCKACLRIIAMDESLNRDLHD